MNKLKEKDLTLGIDVGTNSIGWALIDEKNGQISHIVDMGVRIFSKSVEEKVPTPKNKKRRVARLTRRVIERRARRRQRLANYLISLNLLPQTLKRCPHPETILNELGNPYQLRTQALDEKIDNYQLGRVLLHFASRRGFLSTKKQLAGDLVNDIDMMEYLSQVDTVSVAKDKEEAEFKQDISDLRDRIQSSGYRTLGEYLYKTNDLPYQRNRSYSQVDHIIRTDRQMYRDELSLIWDCQKAHFQQLPAEFYGQVDQIIFNQRPLKLKADRVGKCSLEPKNKRAAMARLGVQEFRYLQQINHLEYFDRQTEKWLKIGSSQKQQLADFLSKNEKITLNQIRKILEISTKDKLNLDAQIKGNTTLVKLEQALGQEAFNSLSNEQKQQLVEDLLSIQKKSTLKKRLINHWNLNNKQALRLCLIELEPKHSNLSLKAINKLLPFLREGLIYSDARIKAGYNYEIKTSPNLDKLQAPPETRNPIVNKSMNE